VHLGAHSAHEENECNDIATVIIIDCRCVNPEPIAVAIIAAAEVARET